ncbi:MAG: YbaB/EbfC family nucleoid-associated protein [Propionibacteriaceae bacterium]|jgi:DNA-binding protein YbaB|nr:YbaB/EbfC family nucleoid-associated protein [Propionibacteriaceae bacterium]
MFGYSPEAEERLARVAAQIDEAERKAERAAQLRDDIAGLQVEFASADGAVRVRVDSLGRLEHLELGEGARQLTAQALSALVMDTVNQARAEAGRQVMGQVEDVFGTGSDLANQMRDTYLPPGLGEDDPGPEPDPGPRAPGFIKWT